MMKIYLILTLTCISIVSYGQTVVRNVKQELQWLRKALQENHVQPRVIDNTFSRDVFDKLLNDLDPHKLYFTEADISWLHPYRDLLDEEINGKGWIFLNRLKERYKSGLERSERLINETLK